MIKKIKTVQYILFAFIFGALTPVSRTLAEGTGYVPLSTGLPGASNDMWEISSMPALLNLILGVSVAIAAILAVVMLAIGGFKYMTSDSVFEIGGAKEQITNAVVGLLIVLTAILILSTINPDIVKFSLFQIDQ